MAKPPMESPRTLGKSNMNKSEKQERIVMFIVVVSILVFLSTVV